MSRDDDLTRYITNYYQKWCVYLKPFNFSFSMNIMNQILIEKLIKLNSEKSKKENSQSDYIELIILHNILTHPPGKRSLVKLSYANFGKLRFRS